MNACGEPVRDLIVDCHSLDEKFNEVDWIKFPDGYPSTGGSYQRFCSALNNALSNLFPSECKNDVI